MRPEKQYVIDEINTHLNKSNFVFVTDFSSLSVAETADLRTKLAAENAEFHVVKNRLLNVAAQQRELPDMKEYLTGQSAIVVGGSNAPGVAKVLKKFFKDKDKVEVKIGVLENKLLNKDEVDQLAEMPSIEAIKAQLLGLLNTPAQQMARVLNAVPQAVLNVLDAKSKLEA